MIAMNKNNNDLTSKNYVIVVDENDNILTAMPKLQAHQEELANQ